MSKTHTTLSIDADVLRRAKAQFPGQISGILERALENMITLKIPEAEGLTMSEIEKKILMAREQADKARAEHESWTQKKEAIRIAAQARHKKDLDIKTRMMRGRIVSGQNRAVAKYD